jgi:hypothetical protein
MVNLPVYGKADGVPFTHFGIKLSEYETPEEFVARVEQEEREIVGDISNKEFLARRAITGTIPWLNQVFEELGIHHKEHKVPVKVLKSIEDKAKKAAVKNNTAAAESKKRRGAGTAKAISKKRKIGAASTIAFTGTAEEVAKSVHRGSASAAVGIEGEHSTPSVDLGGDDFVETALGGMGYGSTLSPPPWRLCPVC